MVQNIVRKDNISNSNGSTHASSFFPTQSNTEDTNANYLAANHLLTSPTATNMSLASSPRSSEAEDRGYIPSLKDYQIFNPGLTSSSLDRASVISVDARYTTHEELIARSWIPAPNIPHQIIKYAVGRRELSMQSRFNTPFDLVNLEPLVRPPVHTPESEKLKAWHKLSSRAHQGILHQLRETESPQVKIAFGPLGWDQVWGYEYLDLKKVSHNAGLQDWWARRSENHLMWCFIHPHVTIYGAEVRYPYGHDVKLITYDGMETETTIRIPADTYTLIPFGKDVLEWARQISLQHQLWDEGPLFMKPSNSNDPMQTPPTITVRFRNLHPENRCALMDGEDKGGWTKSWMTTDEVTVLSSEKDVSYLDTVIEGGPRPDPKKTAARNREEMLDFWDLEGKREDVIMWLMSRRWVRERFGVDDERVLRAYIRDEIYTSVARAVRATPF